MKQNLMTLTELRETFKSQFSVKEEDLRNANIDFAKIVTYDRLMWEDFVFEEGFVFDCTQSGLAVFWMADDLYIFSIYRNQLGEPNEVVGIYESAYPFNEKVMSYIKKETELAQIGVDTKKKIMPNSKEVMDLILKLKY